MGAKRVAIGDCACAALPRPAHRVHRRAEVLRPTVAAPPAYKELTPENLKDTDGWKVAQPSDATLRGKWWEIFGDPQLNSLEDQVSVSNQNIAAATATFLAARALVKQARAQYYPTVGVNPSITYSRPSHGAIRRSIHGGSSQLRFRAGRSPITRCRSTLPGSRISGGVFAIP